MYITVTKNMFIDAFRQSDSRKEQISYEALEALFDYYTECEDLPDNEIEFDMVGICCDWTEYDTIKEILKNYDLDLEIEDLDENEIEDLVLESLNEKTTVLVCDSSFLVMNF